MIQNIILIAVIAIILGTAGLYIYREKKKGVTCIGCPYANECAAKNSSGTCRCNCKSEHNA